MPSRPITNSSDLSRKIWVRQSALSTICCDKERCLETKLVSQNSLPNALSLFQCKRLQLRLSLLVALWILPSSSSSIMSHDSLKASRSVHSKSAYLFFLGHVWLIYRLNKTSSSRHQQWYLRTSLLQQLHRNSANYSTLRNNHVCTSFW